MTQLFEINVKLSANQKKNLSAACHKRETVVLRLTKNSLRGNDTLYVPAMVKKRLEKNRGLKKGMDIKLAKTNIRKQVGGSLLTSVLALGRAFGPTIAKTLGWLVKGRAKLLPCNPQYIALLKLTMNSGKQCTSRSLHFGYFSAIFSNLKHVSQ